MTAKEISLALTNEHLFLEAVEWAGLRISGLIGVQPAVTVGVQYEEVGTPPRLRLIPSFDVLPEGLLKVGERAALGIVRSTWADVKQELTLRLAGNGARRRDSAKEKKGSTAEKT
jgi:hypothetical protein